jgi:hypothetical protein
MERRPGWGLASSADLALMTSSTKRSRHEAAILSTLATIRKVSE